MKPIIEVNYGLASSYDDGIEINKKLQNYPELRKKIIEHEKRHTKGSYSITDLMNDFRSKDPYFMESLKFCVLNKEALINFFPVMYSYHFKAITFNTSSILPYIYFNTIFSAFFYFLFEISFIKTFLMFFFFIVAINFTLLVYTHIYVEKENKKLREYKKNMFNK